MLSANTYYKRIKFPDPVAHAQKIFPYRPEEYKAAAQAKNSFLKSICDFNNMRSGIDSSNQQFFRPVTNMLKNTSLQELLGSKEEVKKLLSELKAMAEVPQFKNIPEQAKPFLLEAWKNYKEDSEIRSIFQSLKLDFIDTMREELRKDPKALEFMPVKISVDFIKETLKGDDFPSKEPSPFELVMDDPNGDEVDIGHLPVFEQLGLHKGIYLELNPMGEESRTHLSLVNDNLDDTLVKQWPLTENLSKVLFANTVIDGEKTKETYLELIDESCGEEIEALDSDDLSDAELIKSWFDKSIKFREWIAPKYKIDLQKIDDFLEEEARKRQENFKPKIHRPSPSTSTETPSKPKTRSDTRREEEQASFKTPAPAVVETKVKSEYKLSPKGREMLADWKKKDPEADEKTMKERIKRMATNTPSQFADLVEKKDGSGMMSKKNKNQIMISPILEKRLERMKVIYFSHKNGVNNSSDYQEYSAIIDSLVDEGQVTREQRKQLIDAFLSVDH